MKEVRHEFDVDAPWSLALLAYDRKSWGIPNPAIKEILKCDFSDWDVNPDLQQTSFKRRVQFRVPFPGWLMKLLTNDREAFLEFHTVIDRKQKHVHVQGVNLTMRHVIEMKEDLQIFEHPDDPQHKTKMVYVTSWELKFSSWVATRLESLIMSHYGKALRRGRAMDHRFIQQFKRRHSLDDIPLTRSEQSAMEIHKARLDSVIPEKASIASFGAEDIDSGTGNSKGHSEEAALVRALEEMKAREEKAETEANRKRAGEQMGTVNMRLEDGDVVKLEKQHPGDAAAAEQSDPAADNVGQQQLGQNPAPPLLLRCAQGNEFRRVPEIQQQTEERKPEQTQHAREVAVQAGGALDDFEVDVRRGQKEEQPDFESDEEVGEKEEGVGEQLTDKGGFGSVDDTVRTQTSLSTQHERQLEQRTQQGEEAPSQAAHEKQRTEPFPIPFESVLFDPESIVPRTFV